MPRARRAKCMPVAMMGLPLFFFNDPATTEIYTLSLHDALPIFSTAFLPASAPATTSRAANPPSWSRRSEEHTSELQSPDHLVCRLLLEKKKKKIMKKTMKTHNKHK